MEPANPRASSSFAGLLAALASPVEERGRGLDDGLADDIAELSYESELRHSARLGEPSASDGTTVRRAGGTDSDPGVSSTGSATASAASQPGAARGLASDRRAEAFSSAEEPGTRKDRITLRLSRSEVVQLRARAAESGLTVSAYLRTCILEVESLRALVKGALAQMRAPETCDPAQAAPAPAQAGAPAAHRWRDRLFPYRKGSDRAEHAHAGSPKGAGRSEFAKWLFPQEEALK